MRKKGYLIVIEGMDGSGKTTQAKLLKKYLESKGYPVVLLKEPTDGPKGRLIRMKLENGNVDQFDLMRLYAEDRYENVTNNIIPALNDGKIVIVDRYVPSSLVYQSINGPSLEQILEANRFAPIPDMVIIIDIAEEEAIRRMQNENKRRDAFERKEFLKKVKEKYLTLPQELKKFSGWDKTRFIIVNGMRKQEEVFREIKKAVDELLGGQR